MVGSSHKAIKTDWNRHLQSLVVFDCLVLGVFFQPLLLGGCPNGPQVRILSYCNLPCISGEVIKMLGPYSVLDWRWEFGEDGVSGLQ